MGQLRFWVNGREVVEEEAPPTTTLLNYLRGPMGLTGTKEGCAEGDCGACTVAVLDTAAGRWRAVNSCLVLLPMVHGRRLLTVEGLSTKGAAHPVQDAMVRNLGSQCGYCTPGIVMSLFEACYRRDMAEPWQLDDQLCGNLCRCTGYRPIRAAAEEVAGSLPEDAFRAALDETAAPDAPLHYASGGATAALPTSLSGVFDALEAHPDARIVCGGTDLSLHVTKRRGPLPAWVSVERVPELQGIVRGPDGWDVGAGVPLSDLESAADEAGFDVVARMLRFFGARQIKHRATLGGNLCNASPIGDMAPVVMCLEGEVALASRGGTRWVRLEDFFTGYRQTVLAPGEVLSRVRMPLPGPNTHVRAYKVSKRRELDISVVSAGLRVDVQGGVVTRAVLAYGGMAAVTARASRAEAALTGQPWTAATVAEACDAIRVDFAPISDHRGSAWYRAKVAANLLRGFFVECQQGSGSRLPQRPSGTVLGGGAP